MHLRSLFAVLRRFGLVTNKEKCLFGEDKLEFLGHKLSKQGLEPLPDKVRAITAFKSPRTAKLLQRFLEMLNFYRRFLPNIAEVLCPLTDLLVGSPRDLQWTEQMQMSFDSAKSCLARATMLKHLARDANLQLVTDASTNAMGAVVQQVVNRQVQPLAFYSRMTTAAESRYSTYDLELLSVYTAIVHFRHMLEGCKFWILTDQKPLTSTFFKVCDPFSNRQQNQLSFISEFCTDIAHVPGMENIVADALSRQFDDVAIVNTIAHRLADVDLEQLAEDQGNENLQQAETSLDVRCIRFPGVSQPIWCDLSLQRPRILVPDC